MFNASELSGHFHNFFGGDTIDLTFQEKQFANTSRAWKLFLFLTQYFPT